MIIRRDQPETSKHDEGRITQLQYSDAGGLTQYGAYVEILEPGATSSNRHWHEEEDEFLYVISGEATVIENDGPHQLHAGDAACWKASEANAHQVVNRSDSPCAYLIFGTRMSHDTIHYPGLGHVLYDEVDGSWRYCNAEDGTVLKEGDDPGQARPMTWERGFELEPSES